MNFEEIKQKNIKKTWYLMGGFFILITAMGYGFAQYFGNPNILYSAVGMSLFMNFFSYFFSGNVALKMSGSKEIKRGESKEGDRFFNIVDDLRKRMNLPMPKVFLMKEKSINAFASGRNPENASVSITTGAMELLNDKELEGVISHELSHVKNRDILVMTIVVTLVGLIAVIADVFMRGAFRKKGSKGNIIMLIVGIAFAVISPLIAKTIQMAVSRKREYMADSSGAMVTNNPEGLASALEKISRQARPMRKASTATAHMFISSPFGERKKTRVDFLERIFSTHPPVKKRIALLRGERLN